MTRIYSQTFSKSAVLALSLFLGALLFFPSPAGAQGAGETQEGVTSGNYNIRQTFELGYRWEDISGNRATYNTFVNLNPGPRLFEHSLEMRSLNHQGLLFDNFSLASFGYGGDPNNVTRLRMYKNKWYNFNGTFRRDRNFWDYRLLANPLNPNSYPAGADVNAPIFNIPFSPHRMEITRRMSDFGLIVAPQSPIRLRLNYSRNISEGPSLSTFHEGTDVFLLQNWKTSLNSYQFGVDLKLLPKTNISFDQFLHYYKGDTTYTDPVIGNLFVGNSALSRPIYQLSNGQLVDLGLIFNAYVPPVPPSTTPTGQPCLSSASSTPPLTGPIITNPSTSPPTVRSVSCSFYLAYNRGGNVRTVFPTSQLSFQTNYFEKFDISGRLIFSNSTMDLLSPNVLNGYQGLVNFNGAYELFQGLVQRTVQRQFSISGPANAKRYNVTGDYAITWFATDQLRFTDVFRYDRYRIPGNWDSFELSLYAVNPPAPAPTLSVLDPTATFTRGTTPPANCPTVTSPGCPRHVSSSPADIASDLLRRLIKQRTVSNHFEIAYDASKRFGGNIGYRMRHRRIDEAEAESLDTFFFPTLPNRGNCVPGAAGVGFTATNLPDGSCRRVGGTSDSEEETILEHAGLLGLWFRPTDQWRITYDMELQYADAAFTRISPRQRQRYKIRATYKPTEWLNVGGHVNLLEQRNNVDQIFHRQHYRTYAFMVTTMKEKWGIDVGYDYNDVDSKTNICFTLNFTPLPPGSGPCPISVPTATTFAISTYDNRLHFGYLNVMLKPVKRLTTNFGYTVSSTTGDTLILGPINAPRGTLAFNWHKPYAGVEIELEKHVLLKSSWNYYGYNEKQAADVFTSPVDSLGRLVGRDFRGNLFTTSVRFMF